MNRRPRPGVLLLLLLGACRREPAPVAALVPFAPELRVWGALRGIMHEGKTGPQVTLASALQPHTYGVGALSALAGEITVVDGTAFVSRPAAGGAIVVEKNPTAEATLLVLATVPAWKRVPLEARIESGQLDERIEALARQAAMDVGRPFPVLIEGVVNARWHVLGGAGEPGGHGGDHAAHLRNAVTGKLTGSRALLVGFFSRQHEGVFTHMGERTHFHLLSEDRKIMGHIDELVVHAGSVLQLPAR